MSVGGFLWTLWAQGWVLYILKYKFVLDIYCQHFGNIIHLKLYIKRWMCALWAQGSVTYIFYMYIFILDKSCQHLGNTCPLNLYTGIGYILPTIGGYMSVGGFLPQGPTVRGPICLEPPDLPTWPTYLTYLPDIPTWPTYLTKRHFYNSDFNKGSFTILAIVFFLTRVWLCILIQKRSALDGNFLHLTSPSAMGQSAREWTSLACNFGCYFQRPLGLYDLQSCIKIGLGLCWLYQL